MAFRWVALVSVIVSLSTLTLDPSHNLILTDIAVRLMRSVSLLELCLLGFLCLSMNGLRLSVRNMAFGIALGLALISTNDFVNASFLSRNSSLTDAFQFVSEVVILVVLGTWVAYAALPEPAPHPIMIPAKSILFRWNEIASQLGHTGTQVAMQQPANGFLLTNAHVVAEADEIKIFLWQESEVCAAQLVGMDVASDLALLKIERRQPLPFLTLADSDAVAVGEMAAAIGNPFGLEHSITDGLISAKHRRLHEGRQGYFEDFLQTSAAINPGNSGGPLLNLHGEVVGVNTAVVEGGTGIGFAAPSNLVREVVPHLIRAGRVIPSRVGVEIEETTAELAARLHLPERRGGVVKAVAPGSPAEQAGLRPWDAILAVNGRPVYDAVALMRTISLLIADRPATLLILRDGRQFETKVTPIVAPPPKKAED